MDTIRYFDRIKISTFIDAEKLKRILPMKTFKPLCYHFQIDSYSPYNERNFPKYLSRIDLTAPSETALEKLCDCQDRIGSCSINYLEAAEDSITENEHDALQILDRYALTARKKWANKHFVYVPTNLLDFDRKDDPDIFSKKTLYSASKKFGLRAYCRYSKINGLPAFHREYVMDGKTPVRKKANIRELKDLLNFDFPDFFERTDKTYLQFTSQQIDQFQLGKFLRGWTNRKSFTKRELMSIGCHAALYVAYRPTPAELRIYFNGLKKEIRRKRGPLTEWDKRILGLRDISRFLRPEQLQN
jgi:hypothetical protein